MRQIKSEKAKLKSSSPKVIQTVKLDFWNYRSRRVNFLLASSRFDLEDFRGTCGQSSALPVFRWVSEPESVLQWMILLSERNAAAGLDLLAAAAARQHAQTQSLQPDWLETDDRTFQLFSLSHCCQFPKVQQQKPAFCWTNHFCFIHFFPALILNMITALTWWIKSKNSIRSACFIFWAKYRWGWNWQLQT